MFGVERWSLIIQECIALVVRSDMGAVFTDVPLYKRLAQAARRMSQESGSQHC